MKREGENDKVNREIDRCDRALSVLTRSGIYLGEDFVGGCVDNADVSSAELEKQFRNFFKEHTVADNVVDLMFWYLVLLTFPISDFIVEQFGARFSEGDVFLGQADCAGADVCLMLDQCSDLKYEVVSPVITVDAPKKLRVDVTVRFREMIRSNKRLEKEYIHAEGMPIITGSHSFFVTSEGARTGDCNISVNPKFDAINLSPLADLTP